jgi:hypothetical protein
MKTILVAVIALTVGFVSAQYITTKDLKVQASHTIQSAATSAQVSLK